MNFYHWCSGIFLLLFSTAVASSSCQVVGKISDIVNKNNSSSVYVLRAACEPQERVIAFVYQWLYEGDRIEITGDAEVLVSLAKGEKRVFTQNTNGISLHEQTINDIHKNQNSISGKVQIATGIWKALERQRKSIPYFNKVRGSTQNLVITEDPLLPSGLQYLPADYDQIALLWKGGPATVISTSAEKVTEIRSESWSYLVLPISGNQPENLVRLQNRDISWNIKTASTIPVPQGINESDLISPSLQLARALWILKEGPGEWRLFALSELARLSQKGVFSAEELWKAALSGELVSVLQAK